MRTAVKPVSYRSVFFFVFFKITTRKHARAKTKNLRVRERAIIPNKMHDFVANRIGRNERTQIQVLKRNTAGKQKNPREIGRAIALLYGYGRIYGRLW